MNTNTPISENTADALYDAATAQYAYKTLELLRREYNLASPDEQEARDCHRRHRTRPQQSTRYLQERRHHRRRVTP